MKIAIASDRTGFALKQEIVEDPSCLSHEDLNLGAYSTDPLDYPEFAEAVGKSIMASTLESVACVDTDGNCR